MGFNPTTYTTTTRIEYGDYATFMAVEFLISLMREKLYVIADRAALAQHVEEGVNWLLSAYNPKINGWEDGLGSGRADAGLSTLYLALLTQAKELGLDRVGLLIESDQAYQITRRAWLKRMLQDSVKRAIYENSTLKQPQTHYDTSGTSTYRELPVTVV